MAPALPKKSAFDYEDKYLDEIYGKKS